MSLTSSVSYAILVISVITAAGVFGLYTGVIPVAKVTQTATLTSTTTSVTTLPVQVLTSTTTLPALTSTATSITTLPVQVVSVTQTTTSVQTTTATTTQISTTTSVTTTTSTVRTAARDLSNKTQLLDNFKVKIGPRTPCANAPGCMQVNTTTVYTFQAPSAGFIVVTGAADVSCCSVSMNIQYQYSSVANDIGCGVNTECNGSWRNLYPASNQQRLLIPVLPGKVTITLTNWSNQTATASLSAWYYN